ncbi:hypothetical protein E2C01_045430 [Portunus trituberculatus]|uniref:Uncharacterized protein n=1 Tax=Portunus trituberculatus TaxID=210409 RepID=A0A5B7FVR8_PORTR|nr:hypothetical protein [Portunus trituberculatus]
MDKKRSLALIPFPNCLPFLSTPRRTTPSTPPYSPGCPLVPCAWYLRGPATGELHRPLRSSFGILTSIKRPDSIANQSNMKFWLC